MVNDKDRGLISIPPIGIPSLMLIQLVSLIEVVAEFRNTNGLQALHEDFDAIELSLSHAIH